MLMHKWTRYWRSKRVLSLVYSDTIQTLYRHLTDSTWTLHGVVLCYAALYHIVWFAHRHTHTDIHTQTYTYRHTRTHTDTHIHTQTYKHTDIHIQTYTHRHTHTDIHIQTYTHTHTHNRHTHTDIYTQTYTHWHAHTDIHTQTYTHRYINTDMHTHTYIYVYIYRHTLLVLVLCDIYWTWNVYTHTDDVVLLEEVFSVLLSQAADALLSEPSLRTEDDKRVIECTLMLIRCPPPLPLPPAPLQILRGQGRCDVPFCDLFDILSFDILLLLSLLFYVYIYCGVLTLIIM